jgi:hypothetical protein
MADYRAAARRFARKYGLNPGIFIRQISQESGFNPNAVSPAGAIGIAQIMPATARGWGVNPHDPMASLDAAAKNMARYVHQYGSYRDALVAYNAGPGRVGHSLPSETQRYIANILGGRNPSPSSANPGQTSTTTTTTTPGVDNSSTRQQLFQQYIGDPAQRHDPSALINLFGQLRQSGDIAPTTSTVTTSGGGTPAPTGNFRKSHSPLLELFWQGQGGIDAKNGQKVPQGFVSGHTDHVHLAAGPKTVVDLGRIAQQRFGLHVGENPHFGGVHPVHVANSFHYKGEAIDVSGDPGKMRAFAHYVARLYGIK